MAQELTDDEIRDQIRLKMTKLRAEFEAKLRPYVIALEALESPKKVTKQEPNLFGQVIIGKAIQRATSLQDRAHDLLSIRNYPMLVKEMNTELGGDPKGIKKFSAHFSMVYKKVGIVKYEIGEGSDKKYFYCLNSWFAPNGELKKEYLEKIFERHGLRKAA